MLIIIVVSVLLLVLVVVRLLVLIVLLLVLVMRLLLVMGLVLLLLVVTRSLSVQRFVGDSDGGEEEAAGSAEGLGQQEQPASQQTAGCVCRQAAARCGPHGTMVTAPCDTSYGCSCLVTAAARSFGLLLLALHTHLCSSKPMRAIT